jgi:hypothetical protein
MPARNYGEVGGKEDTAGRMPPNGDDLFGKLLDFTLHGSLDMNELNDDGRAFHDGYPERCSSTAVLIFRGNAGWRAMVIKKQCLLL